MIARQDLPEEAGTHRWTKAQEEAFDKLTARAGECEIRVTYSFLFENVMIENFHGMVVGIEKDGYTHS